MERTRRQITKARPQIGARANCLAINQYAYRQVRRYMYYDDIVRRASFASLQKIRNYVEIKANADCMANELNDCQGIGEWVKTVWHWDFIREVDNS